MDDSDSHLERAIAALRLFRESLPSNDARQIQAIAAGLQLNALRRPETIEALDRRRLLRAQVG